MNLRKIKCGYALAALIVPVCLQAQSIPNMDQQITPLMPTGSGFTGLNPGLPKPAQDWLVSQAVTSVVSGDGKTMLVMTSGYNRFFTDNNQPPTGVNPWFQPDSNEYVFIYDISHPIPSLSQVVQMPFAYSGIVFDPTDPAGSTFYTGGCAADAVLIVSKDRKTGAWPSGPTGSLSLGHTLGIGLDVAPNGAAAVNSQVGVHPCAAGVAVSNDGQTLAVANHYNDSITVFTGGPTEWLAPPGSPVTKVEIDLRPGKSSTHPQVGTPGGEYPYWIALKGNGSSAIAYVSSVRDREIDVVSLGASPEVTERIAVVGQPNRMVLNKLQSLLYVAVDQTDTVDVIDTNANKILETIPVITPFLPPALASPPARTAFRGANPNSVALSPDETQLYITDGNLNSVSVVALNGTSSNDKVLGLIPTGWYPNSVSLSGDGNTVYVINGKSPTGANPNWCYGGYGPPGEPACFAANQYNPQLTKSGLQYLTRPTTQLAALTQQVAVNNRFSYTESDGDKTIMAAVRAGIQHVIFILKENRSYDQILGDLPVGNGQPSLTLFGQAVTPNIHKLAQNFVTLDNFLCTAEVSYDGWAWSTSAQATDVVQKSWPVAYGSRGLGLDGGTNRGVNVALPSVTTGTPQGDVLARQSADPLTSSDPDVLPGHADVTSPDGPNQEINGGYLWNNAMASHLTVRSYGFFVDGTLYNTVSPVIPVLRNPFSTGTVVAYSTDATLSAFTDPYFRGFDNSLPDFWRYSEWARDFDANERRAKPGVRGRATPAGLAALTLVRFMHDHTGNFDVAIDGVNTPELMVADNDYAVGMLVQKISESKYANNTLIFVVEDDAQDGGDHMDSHRTVALVVGAYVKQGVVVQTAYNTIDFVRTMEEVMGLPPMNLNDALGRPMTDIFNTTPSPWSYTAAPSALLYHTQLPLDPHPAGGAFPRATHDAKYWAKVTNGMDFTDADRVDSDDYNHVLWKGIMGAAPYPAAPTGLDLRMNRAGLLKRFQLSLKPKVKE